VKLKYFAYGSNMYTNRLRQRVSSAEKYAVATLKAYDLRFHKISIDSTGNRSGKCNVFHTENPMDEVIGVVFEIEDAQKPELDKVEDGYEETLIEVNSAEGIIRAYMYYVTDPALIDDSLCPYTWYKDFVVQGAKQHQLPEQYIQRLGKVKAIPDPNKRREQRNYSILLGEGRKEISEPQQVSPVHEFNTNRTIEKEDHRILSEGKREMPEPQQVSPIRGAIKTSVSTSTEYEIAGVRNVDTIEHLLQVKASLISMILGALLGGVGGWYTSKGGAIKMDISEALGLGVSLVLASMAVVLFARKKDVQPLIAVEDFWGGIAIGFLVAYSGPKFFGKLLGNTQ
jgi:hypothetical protein